MSLDFGKRDVSKMAAVLDPEYTELVKRVKAGHKALKLGDDDNLQAQIEADEALIESIEAFAADALLTAMEIIEAKAKFTVVGQVTERGNKGDKIALGWYATEKQALDDALKLAYSSVTHEEARAWVLPLHHLTPHAWYTARKDAQKAEAAADSSYRESELQRRQRWIAEHSGEPLPLDWTVEIAFEAQTDECESCKGMGRIPQAELPRRADLDRAWN